MDALAFQKMAEELKKELKTEHPAKILAKSIAGLGVGAGLGYGAGLGVDALLKARGHAVHPSTAAKILPVLGGALGIAAPHFFQMTNQKAQAAYAKRQQEGRREPAA